MDDMNDNMRERLAEMKAICKSENIAQHPQFDDYCLLRFLRARKFDIEKTMLMFRTHLAWRDEVGADDVITVRIIFVK